MKEGMILKLDLILALLLLMPLWFDLKQGIIPNYFVLGLMIYGFVFNIYLTGLSGMVTSVLGFGLGLFMFLIPFILRGIGAGDVKLAAAIGAVKGPAFIFVNILVIAVVGGVISLLILFKQKRLNKISKLINKLVYQIPLDNLKQSNSDNAFPYGIAIVVGTWCSLLLQGLNIWPI